MMKLLITYTLFFIAFSGLLYSMRAKRICKQINAKMQGRIDKVTGNDNSGKYNTKHEIAKYWEGYHS